MESYNKIAIDTNMLLYIMEEGFDLFYELEKKYPNAKIIVPESVKKELEKISVRGKKEGRNAARAIREIEGKASIEIGKDNADNELLELSRQGVIIATHDKELKRLIKSFGGKIICLRNKKKLEVV